METLSPTPVILGASRLGERPGADDLADALISSRLGYVDTSNN
ncbi:hypothetical protein [Microbacterium oleivorans]|nr:hypothetical protein [Microbacterium oleivorans]